MGDDAKAERHVRLAAGSLLLAERKMRADLDDAVDETVAAAVVNLEKPRHGAGHGPSKAVLLGSLLLAGKAMSGRVERAVLDGRVAARVRGLDRLSVELRSKGAGEIVPLLRDPRLWQEEDAARAAAAGASLSSQWQGMAVFSALKALRTGEAVAPMLKRTAGPMASRTARTAATEVANAFNGERREALREAVEKHPHVARLVSDAGIGRRWEALLDACDACGSHQGDVVRLDESWDGDEPGEMHNHCRCIWSLVNMDDERRRAA